MIDSNKKLESFLRSEFDKIRRSGKIISGTSKYFGQIGSTQNEDIAYDTQLEIKKKAVSEIFKGIVNDSVLNNLKITASPITESYRFKMDFVCNHNPKFEPHERFGQRKKGVFSWVIDMDECNLIDETVFKNTRNIYDEIRKLGISNYDLKNAKGELRYITVKAYKNESMLLITLNTLENIDKYDLIATLALESFKSVYIILNDTLGDTSEGKIIKYWGKEFLDIDLKSNNKIYTFKVGPETFFQNNIYCFEKILDYINSELSNISDFTLYDYYCGVGTIGICLSSQFKNIIGVELSRQSIELAKLNAVTNNLSNTEFSSSDIKDINSKLNKPNICIVDPPRIGLSPESIQNIIKLESEKIIYISCNPVTQARDLKKFDLFNYKAEEIHTFDMFPHTNHIENVVILCKS